MNNIPTDSIAHVLRQLANLLDPPKKPAQVGLRSQVKKPAKRGRPIVPGSLRQRARAQFEKGRTWKQTLHTLGPAGLKYHTAHTYYRRWVRERAEAGKQAG